MSEFYAHLGLSEWPFTVVPRPEFCTFIADRPRLREDIAFLLSSLSRRDTSSIHVLWSSLGAGKTHALFYLANESRRISEGAVPVTLLPIYTEFPKGVSSFVDLYRGFITRLNQVVIADAFLEVSTNSAGDEFYQELQASSPDLATALRVLAIDRDVERRAVCVRWLRADRLPVSEFRRVGISQRLDSTEQATTVMAVLVRLLSGAARLRGHRASRVIWLLDEFQRLDRTSPRAIADVNAGLHSVFNSCPVGLTQVISFTGPPHERSLPDCFSPELRDRIGTTKVLVLPPLQRDEAVGFVVDVLGRFRLTDASVPSAFFPFTEQACRHIIQYLAGRTELRPRALMHAFNAVLEVAEAKIQAGTLDVITPSFADSVLGQYVVLTDAEEEE